MILLSLLDGKANRVMTPINYFDKVNQILLLSLSGGVKHVLTLQCTN